MKGYKLRLDEYGSGKIFDLAFHPLSQQKPLAELLTPPKVKVYTDRKYDFIFLGPQVEKIQSLEVQLNGYVIDTNFRSNSGRIYFNDSFTEKGVFANCFGLSYIVLKVRLGNKTHILISDYFQVMVIAGGKTGDTYNVNFMGNFTANHNSKLLYEYKDRIFCPHPLDLQTQYSMEDKIRHLKYILYWFEKNLSQLEATSKSLSREVIGRFQPDAASIQELMRRPDLFNQVPKGQGVRIGFQNFAPDIIRLSPKVESELYEDQVIVSFLREALQEIPALSQSLQQVFGQMPTQTESIGVNTYVSSSSYMTQAMRLTLQSMVHDLEDIQKQLERLHSLYQKKLGVHDIPLSTLPGPTSTFLNVPIYRSIYEAIRQWFAMRQVNAANLRFARAFFQITTLYEVYVLTKLGECLEDWGFTLVEARQVHYELEAEVFYRNPEINNVFVYQKDDLEITLYYQPVIWDAASGKPCICGLYRTVSLSYPKTWNESTHGRYYTPDYVIRLKRQGWKGARYIIADAKYTHYQDVHDFKIIPLLYKYLFSLGPKHVEDKITGLYIFHGKRQNVLESQTLVHSAYDLISNGHERFPQVEIISLYEYAGTIQRDQFKMLRDLLEVQIEAADQETLEDLALQDHIEQRAKQMAQELYEEKCKAETSTIKQKQRKEMHQRLDDASEKNEALYRPNQELKEAIQKRKIRLQKKMEESRLLQGELQFGFPTLPFKKYAKQTFPLTLYEIENQASLHIETLIRLFIEVNAQAIAQEESRTLGVPYQAPPGMWPIQNPQALFKAWINNQENQKNKSQK